MKRMEVLRIIFCIPLLIACISEKQAIRPEKWAVPVFGTEVMNFYKVDNHVYRSAQPDIKGMRTIQEHGIRNVLNLRWEQTDIDKAAGTDLKLYHVPMDPAYINDSDVVKALKVIKEARKPVLVHCWYGSDRTGLIIAMYRIIFHGWTKSAAIDEMINGGYDFHSQYSNIIFYIEDVELAGIRKSLEIQAQIFK